MEGVDKSVKDEIKCYDDLRSNLNLITDHTDGKIGGKFKKMHLPSIISIPYLSSFSSH